MRDFTRSTYRTFEDAVRDQRRRLREAAGAPNPREYSDPIVFARDYHEWLDRHERARFDGVGEGQRR